MFSHKVAPICGRHSLNCCYNGDVFREVGIQWNLRIKGMLGQGVLSLIERFPLFGG